MCDKGNRCAAAVMLAEMVEDLAALISRELDTDANEGAAIQDPQWAEALERVVVGGRRALAVLDEPQILRVLAPVPSAVQEPKLRAKRSTDERSVRFAARFGSACPACGEDMEAGDPVAWSSGEVVHDSCAEEAGVEVYDRG